MICSILPSSLWNIQSWPMKEQLAAATSKPAQQTLIPPKLRHYTSCIGDLSPYLLLAYPHLPTSVIPTILGLQRRELEVLPLIMQSSSKIRSCSLLCELPNRSSPDVSTKLHPTGMWRGWTSNVFLGHIILTDTGPQRRSYQLTGGPIRNGPLSRPEVPLF